MRVDACVYGSAGFQGARCLVFGELNGCLVRSILRPNPNHIFDGGQLMRVARLGRLAVIVLIVGGFIAGCATKAFMDPSGMSSPAGTLALESSAPASATL